MPQKPDLIQYNFIYTASVTINIVSKNTGPNSQTGRNGKKKIPFNRKKPWAGPSSYGGVAPAVGWVKEESEEDRSI